jgi:hypothetical protein
MKRDELLADVRNDRIEFATTRPPGSAFAALQRQVVVTGPASLAALAKSGDPAVLEGLVNLLGDPERAWAAQVLLAAMTGQEARLVDSFAAHPDQWWQALGQTAQARWTTWLAENRDSLAWDAQKSAFVRSQ